MVETTPESPSNGFRETSEEGILEKSSSEVSGLRAQEVGGGATGSQEESVSP